jgi:hypothetical protein
MQFTDNFWSLQYQIVSESLNIFEDGMRDRQTCFCQYPFISRIEFKERVKF